MNATQEIRWRAIVSLVFLDLAILISWLAYHEYQPALLAKFQFSEFAIPLAILQGLILFITPPIAGLMADRLVRKGGNRLPVVTIGINFVSMVFMVVAVTILVKDPGGIIRWLFPVMVALWLVAMNIFHSPAISTIELFVPPQKLPIVIAIFAILSDLIAATEPVLVDIIDFFGAPITFATGGLLVFGTGFWFQRASKKLVANHDETSAEPSSVVKSNFVSVFLLGLGVGAFMTCFFKLFPNWMDDNPAVLGLVGIPGGYFTSILIAFAALFSFPMGILAQKVGTKKLAIIGAAVAAAIIGLLQLNLGSAEIGLYALYPIAFAACSVTFLPLAFGHLEKRHLVFGIGIFFSGFEMLASLVDVLQFF